MNRWLHLGARFLTVAGIALTGWYLGWRVAGSVNGAPLWLSVPALLVEIVGFVAIVVLAWALWWEPTPAPVAFGPRALSELEVDVVVRVDRQPLPDVRATLLAAQSMRDVQATAVVDLSGRAEVKKIAIELRARYIASPDDGNGLRAACAAGDGAAFVLLDAGDIPAEGLVAALAPWLHDPAVSVVQGSGIAHDEDSAEHGPNGVHELAFERCALNPSLGTRGAAQLTGSGALVKRVAFAAVDPGRGPAIEAEWRASQLLIRGGWRVVAPAAVPVLVHRPVHSQEAVHTDRVARARAARAAVFGADGALRAGPMTLRQRAALLAWSVRPLSGLRRGVFVAVVLACLLSGWEPFEPSPWVFTRIWLPGIVATTVGLSALSGWVMRPGDRTRWSLQSLGAAYASLRPAQRRSRRALVTLPAVHRGLALVVVVVILSAVLALRGVSDRWTHTLGDIPRTALVGMVAVGLWLLALSLDSLRMLARRTQLRRAQRVVASLPASLDGAAVFVVDVTPFGAGIVSDGDHSRGDLVTIEAVMPTASGITSVVLPGTVRNVRKGLDGALRVGVEFGSCSPATANALAEHCTIEPARRLLGSLPEPAVAGSAPYAEDLLPSMSGRRVLLRLTSLLAVAGAVASAAPSTANAQALRAPHLVSGSVVVGSVDVPAGSHDGGLAGAVVLVVCSLSAGADGTYGTSDDTYSPPVSAVTAADGAYELDVAGNACWLSAAPPDGYTPGVVDAGAAPAALTPIDVSGHTVIVDPMVMEAASPAALPGTASVADLVWLDANGDGVRQATEAGAPSVHVTLYDAAGAVVRTGVTDVVGAFVFGDLGPGDYSVGVSNLRAGLGFTTPQRGDDPAVDSDADPLTGRTNPVTVSGLTPPSGLSVGLVSSDAAVPQSAGESAQQVLARPLASQVAPAPGTPGGVLAAAVLAVAAVLGASILLGTARPRRRS